MKHNIIKISSIKHNLRRLKLASFRLMFYVSVFLFVFLALGVKEVNACFGSSDYADFSVDNDSPVVGETIVFSDNSNSSDIENWSWSFGSGAVPPTATGQGPHEVYYTSQGLKTVALTIFDADNNSLSETKSNYINVGCIPINTYSVTNTGIYCYGEGGVVIGLNGSQSDVSYQLRLNGENTGPPLEGDGTSISFGTHTELGEYSVVAYGTGSNYCTNVVQMTGLVTINSVYNSQTGLCYPSIQAAVDAFGGEVTGGPQYIEIRNNGTYNESVIINNIVTSATNTLTIKAQEGKNPIINGGSNGSCFKINNTDYLTLEKLRITGASKSDDRYGIWVGYTATGAGASNHLTIRECKIYDNLSHGIIFSRSGGSNILIENNLFYGQGGDDIQTFATSSMSNIIVKNNTFYNSGGNFGCISFNSNGSNISNISMLNNIFFQTGSACCVRVTSACQTGFSSDYNNYYAPSGNIGIWGTTSRSTLDLWQSSSGVDSNSINEDPLFVNPSEKDFHLQSTYGYASGNIWPPSTAGTGWSTSALNSPSIDAGSPTSEYSNETECNGERINQGCYGNTVQASKSDPFICVDRTSVAENPITQVESKEISTLVNDISDAVEVFAFKVTDLGNPGDNLPTKISTITIRQLGGTVNIDDVVEGAVLIHEATTIDMNSVQINESSITFDLDGTFNITNGESKKITMSIWLKASGITDNSNISFYISQEDHGFIAEYGGSDFDSSFPDNINGNLMTFTVTATELVFDSSEPPSSVDCGNEFSVTVNAVDVNGNIDTNAEHTVSISKASGDGELSSSTGFEQSLSSGTYTWTDVIYDSDDSFTILASADGLESITSSSITSNPMPPSAPVSLSSTDFTLDGFTANWESVTGASHYLLDISDSETFDTFIGEFEDYDVGNNTSYIVEGLDQGKYYYRVRAVGNCGISDYSSTQTAFTKKYLFTVGSGQEYSTIQDALDDVFEVWGSEAFDDNVEVRVFNGTYNEAVSVNSDLNTGSSGRLLINNAENNSPILDGEGSDAIAFSIDVDYVTISGLTIHSYTEEGISLQGSSNSIISFNQIYDCGSSGMLLDASTNVTVQNNLIYNNSGHGIHLDNGSNNAVVKNNTVYGNGVISVGEDAEFFEEDFTGVSSGNLPAGWSRTHNNWAVNSSSNAGGDSPELRFNWSPSSTSVFRVKSSKIDAGDYSDINLSFKTMVDHYGSGCGDYDLRVQASLNGSDWTNYWHRGGCAGDLSATTINVDLSDFDGEEFYIAFVLDGYSWDINQWYIDDIVIYGGGFESAGTIGGLFASNTNEIEITNNIFYSLNHADSYAVYIDETASISNASGWNNIYSDNEIIAYLDGNISDIASWNDETPGSNLDISEDPMFVNPDELDFHLKSEAYNGTYVGGVWPPLIEDGGVWTSFVGEHSLSISTGNPADSNENEPEYNAGRINQGAYGNTVQASLAISCPIPSSLNATNISYSQADLEWVESGSAELWNIELTLSGLPPSGTATVSDIDDIPYTITGLFPDIEYDFYVQANCGDGDISSWAGPYTFRTQKCYQPEITGVTAITAFSARLNWSVGGSESEWEAVVGPNGFNPDNPGEYVNHNNDLSINSWNATGLSPETNYQFYVRAKCEEGLYSNWAGPASFTSLEVSPVVFHNTAANPHIQTSFNNIGSHTLSPVFTVSAAHPFDRIQIELNTKHDFTGDSYVQEFEGEFTTAQKYDLHCDDLNIPEQESSYFVRGRASVDDGNTWLEWSNETWIFNYIISPLWGWNFTSSRQFSSATLIDDGYGNFIVFNDNDTGEGIDDYIEITHGYSVNTIVAAGDQALREGGSYYSGASHPCITTGAFHRTDDTHGFRFQNTTIPKGADIVSATFLPYAHSGTNCGARPNLDNPLFLNIFGVNQDNASTWSSSTNSSTGCPRNRLKTTASKSWDIPSTDAWTHGGLITSAPDVTDIVQEIIDRPGFQLGNTIGIIVQNSGSSTSNRHRYFATRNLAGNSSAARLEVEYTNFVNRIQFPEVKLEKYANAIVWEQLVFEHDVSCENCEILYEVYDNESKSLIASGTESPIDIISDAASIYVVATITRANETPTINWLMLTAEVSDPLPVDLVEFKANCEKGEVVVKWTTASEINNDYFILEKSKDMTRFGMIANINGKGFSNFATSYKYIDKNPYTGDNYYRLTQVDYDGTLETFSIINTYCPDVEDENVNVDIYPNPFSQSLNISIQSEINYSNVYIDVFNETGKLVYSKKLKSDEMIDYYELNLHHLTPSVYYIRVYSDTFIKNVKIIKSK